MPNPTSLALQDTLHVADFFAGDPDDALKPPGDFLAWRRATAQAASAYEPTMHGAPRARTRISSTLGDPEVDVVNLASYDYLGLGSDPAVVGAARRALESFGTGASGSPMLSGRTEPFLELEREILRSTGREAALLFPSGFGGALGALAGVLRRGDVGVLDEISHVSLQEGVKLSGARLRTFAHNDPASLDAVLAASAGRRRVVVVEGIYSMDGDIAELPALLEVCESHGVGMVVDEAHSFMTLGNGGGGAIEHHGVDRRVALQVGTLSKSLAGMGGFVAGGAELIDYIRLFANGYGFSCALPPSVLAGAAEAVRLALSEPERRARLKCNAEYFRDHLRAMGLDTGLSSTHVVPIMLGERRQQLYEWTLELRRRGVFLAPVDYPSVPEKRLRFRASITAAHSRADLDRALEAIEAVVVRGLSSGRAIGSRKEAWA